MELHKIISKLNKLTDSVGIEKIFIGGSYALKHVYNVLQRDTEDIDVIIYDFNQKQLDWILDHFNVDLNHPYPIRIDADSSVFYINAIFDDKKVKINFITYKSFVQLNSYAFFQTIPVVPLKAILDAKLEYNRPKDKADLLDIMMELNNPTDSHLPKDCISRPKSVKKETAKKNGLLSEL
jgi:hypothetical protein